MFLLIFPVSEFDGFINPSDSFSRNFSSLLLAVFIEHSVNVTFH